MYNNTKISVVIPAFNSQECIQNLVSRLHASLADVDYQLILVNDCSPDHTWSEIKNAAQKDKRIIGINLRKNSGQDNAIMAGLTRVTGDYVVIMDDDLQHAPEDIKTLISEIQKTDSDVCFAIFPQKKQKHWKNLGSWFTGKMAEIIINKPPSIYLSPFKAITREIVEEILKYRGPYPYVDGLIFTITQNVTQISIPHHDRYAGKGNYTFVRSVAVWLKLMTNFSVFPLRISSFIGGIASAFGFILAVFYLARYFLVGETVEGWTSLMIVISFLCGIILLALGVVGEYLGRAYILLNQRQQYSIKEELNGEDHYLNNKEIVNY